MRHVALQELSCRIHREHAHFQTSGCSRKNDLRILFLLTDRPGKQLLNLHTRGNS